MKKLMIAALVALILPGCGAAPTGVSLNNSVSSIHAKSTAPSITEINAALQSSASKKYWILDVEKSSPTLLAYRSATNEKMVTPAPTLSYQKADKGIFEPGDAAYCLHTKSINPSSLSAREYAIRLEIYRRYIEEANRVDEAGAHQTPQIYPIVSFEFELYWIGRAQKEAKYNLTSNEKSILDERFAAELEVLKKLQNVSTFSPMAAVYLVQRKAAVSKTESKLDI